MKNFFKAIASSTSKEKMFVVLFMTALLSITVNKDNWMLIFVPVVMLAVQKIIGKVIIAIKWQRQYGLDFKDAWTVTKFLYG